MSKFPVRKLGINKLENICPYLKIELEARSNDAEYTKLCERYINNKLDYIYLNNNDVALIRKIYEDNEYPEIENIDTLFNINTDNTGVLQENYKQDVDTFYNDLKSLLIDEGPEASLILNLVYDDLYKHHIRLDIVQRYADVDYSIYQMLLARKALLSGLDDIEVDFIFSTNLSQDQQSEIINALRTDVPYLTIKKWIKNKYTPAQIELATRCYVMSLSQSDTDKLINLNLDDEMTQYVKQAIQYKIPVSKILDYLANYPLIDFKRAIRNAKKISTI